MTTIRAFRALLTNQLVSVRLTALFALLLTVATVVYHAGLMTLVWDELWFDRITREMIVRDGWWAPFKASNHLGYGSLFWSLLATRKLLTQSLCGLTDRASLQMTIAIFSLMLASPYWLMVKLCRGAVGRYILLIGLWATTLIATWYGKIISADSLLVMLTVCYAAIVHDYQLTKSDHSKWHWIGWLLLGLMTGLKPYSILLGVFLLPTDTELSLSWTQISAWFRASLASLRWQHLLVFLVGLALSSMGWWNKWLLGQSFVVLDHGRVLGFELREEVGWSALVNVVANPAKYMLDGPVSAGFLHAVWSPAVVALLIYVTLIPLPYETPNQANHHNNLNLSRLLMIRLVLVIAISAVAFSLGVKYYAWYWYPVQVMSLLLLVRQRLTLIALCLLMNLLNNHGHIGYQLQQKKLDLLAQRYQQADYQLSREWLNKTLPDQSGVEQSLKPSQIDTLHYYDAWYNHQHGYQDQDYWTCIRSIEDSLSIKRFNKPYLALIISVRNVTNMRAMVKQYHLSYPIRDQLGAYDYVAAQNLTQGCVYLYQRRKSGLRMD